MIVSKWHLCVLGLTTFVVGVLIMLYSTLRDWHWARVRKMDLEYVWEPLKKHAESIGQARRAFMVHAVGEPAWADYYGADLWKIVRNLK